MNRRPSQSRSGYDSFSPRHTAHFTASSPDTHFFEAKRKRPLGQRLLLAAAVLLLSLLLINVICNQFVFISRISVPIKGLSELFEGYTLLHISDLKGARFGSGQELLRFALQNESFDAVVFTGDMVSDLGNAQPLYALIDVLRELNPDAPIYFIPGDDDPTPVSMNYASGGSPFAPWVLGAQQRGAQLLSAPQAITRGEQTLYLTTNTHLSVDVDTMQGQFEQQYLRAIDDDDENEIELATYNLQWLAQTRAMRKAIQDSDVLITLAHVPPAQGELSQISGGLAANVDLMLSGHYLGGLIRLPFIGPLFIPSQSLSRYGLFPGSDTYYGLSREGHTYLYTSSGLGAGDSHYPSFFFRLNNPPTVTLVSLTMSTM